MSLLEVTNLHATVGAQDQQKAILKGLNISVNPGEVHAIMGPNGSGKSTLANVLSGRPGYTVTDGTLTLADTDLTELEPHERAQLGLFLAFPVPGRNSRRFKYGISKGQHRLVGQSTRRRTAQYCCFY